MGLSYGYFHKPCVSGGSLALRVMLPVKAMAPVLLLTMRMSVQLLMGDQFGENGRNGVQGENAVEFSSLFFLFFLLQLFLFTFSHSCFLLYFAISFYLSLAEE